MTKKEIKSFLRENKIPFKVKSSEFLINHFIDHENGKFTFIKRIVWETFYQGTDFKKIFFQGWDIHFLVCETNVPEARELPLHIRDKCNTDCKVYVDEMGKRKFKNIINGEY